MKKVLALLLVLVQIIAIFAGCAQRGTPEETVPSESTGIVEPTTEATENTLPTETEPIETEPVETTQPETEPTETTPVETEAPETEPTETEPPETEPVETEPEVVWTEVDETVYATSSVNVRRGPSTDYDKIGSLNRGDSVTRIAVGDNGWSKVIYKDQEAYIHSDYLSTKKPVDNSTVSYDGLEVVKEALKYLGLEYVYGGNSLKTGTDCSGFTKLIYAKFGIELPRTAAEQAKVGEKISYSEIKPGDLYVAVYNNNSKYTGHAGIYITNEYISAMPGSGVGIDKDLFDNLTIYRIGNNTYDGTWTEARFELMRYCIEELGMNYGIHYVTYYPEEDSCVGWGYARYKDDPFTGQMDLINDVDEYPSLVKKLKQKYIDDPEAYFRVDGSDGTCYGYLNGKWYTSSELWDMEEAGEIEGYSLYFYGLPWDIASGVTTESGEEVDFSTFPGLN